MKVDRYGLENISKRQTPTKGPGPIIIGQEESDLDRALSKLALSEAHEIKDSQSPRQLHHHNVALNGSLTDRKEAGGHHIPSPLISVNTMSQGYSTPASLYSPTWGSACNHYGAYSLNSPLWSPYSPGTIGQERGSPSMPIDQRNFQQSQSRISSRSGLRQQPDFATGHHNIVDVDRIRAGLDVRTTVCALMAITY